MEQTSMTSGQTFDLSGKTALVTGASSGIGLTIVAGLRAAGARVVVHGRDAGRVREAAASLGGEAVFDVTDENSVDPADLVARVGRIDILVNDAGMQSRAPPVDFDLAVWHQVIATNLTSAFLVGRTVARGMAVRGGGRIINMCSLMSEAGRKSIGPYTAAKGGLKQLTRAMAVEWASDDIQVNAIGPGYFATRLNKALSDDPAFDAWLKARTPAGRWGRVEELIGPAVFLASDASSFVTGQVLHVDGGSLASI